MSHELPLTIIVKFHVIFKDVLNLFRILSIMLPLILNIKYALWLDLFQRVSLYVSALPDQLVVVNFLSLHLRL